MNAIDIDAPPRPPWHWHGDAWAITEGLANRWPKGPAVASRWLIGQLGQRPADVIAWAGVMKEAVAMAVDRTAPTAFEIQECARMAERRGR